MHMALRDVISVVAVVFTVAAMFVYNYQRKGTVVVALGRNISYDVCLSAFYEIRDATIR